MLIRALAHIPGATLDIVGGGEDEGALRTLAAVMGVTNRIRFLGHVSRDEALACAASADLFVQVSFFEGHSLALIEAARLGLALIVSDVPVQREGVTAADGMLCAVVVPIGDDAALAHAATRLLDEPAALRDGAALARKLGRDASNRAMVDRYEALLITPDLRPV
jgi:glycosyltransferase involved in cell wall biosynthesis